MNRNQALNIFAQAETHYRQGRHDQALALLRHLLRVFPGNRVVLYAMALCHEGLDNREDALRLCDQLIREFHYDKAMILKARLITIPSDPPRDIDDGFDENTSWPAKLESVATNTPSRKTRTPAPKNALGWKVAPCIPYAMLATGLPFFVLLFAQAETTVPGASPTLFPGRLAAILSAFMILASGVTTFFLVKENHTLPHRAQLLNITEMLLLALFWIIPMAGWATALMVSWKRYRLSKSRCLMLLIAVVVLYGYALGITAFALGMTSLHDVYMELRAGYG